MARSGGKIDIWTFLRGTRSNPALPISTHRFLRRYAIRHRLVRLIGSVGSAAAVFLVCLLAMTLLDGAFILTHGLNTTLLILIATAETAFVLRCLIELSRQVDPVRTAILIEERMDVFDQRLITVASLGGGQRRSGDLVRRLTEQVEEILSGMNPRPKISLRPLVLPWFSTSIMLIVIALLGRSPGGKFRQSLSHLLVPSAEKQVVITATLPEGQTNHHPGQGMQSRSVTSQHILAGPRLMNDLSQPAGFDDQLNAYFKSLAK